MRVVLVALDAQYVHTNLAVRSIAAYCGCHGLEKPEIAEFTINMRNEQIIEALYERAADVYAFSCYIWNIEQVCALAAELSIIRPDAVIAAGGPQVSYHSREFLEANPAFDMVLRGEGEQSCLLLFSALEQKTSLSACPGITYREGETILETPVAAPLKMDELPMAYSLPLDTKGRILYYESMRGCPFGCSYCLSSLERGVRFKSLALVEKELAVLMREKPKQIKFVDRTFNCNPAHAKGIWDFLRRMDNGVTNFHFELAGELLEEETIEYLAAVRPGLFQFEIGVQTTNQDTLREINRPAGLDKLFAQIQKLQRAGNIHIHLDLIAGLPKEGFESFTSSFNQVYRMRPHQLQLGFLKVLPGSEMERKAPEYGLVCQPRAPFEVLYTRWIGYAQLAELKRMAAMVELYYNSGRFSRIIEYLVGQYQQPFVFWRRLADFYKAGGYGQAQLSKIGQYELLGEFMAAQGYGPTEEAKWLCRYDLILHEKPKAAPAWVDVDGARPYREIFLEFYSDQNIARFLPEYQGYNPKQILKMAHLERFPFHPQTGEKKECYMLFNYARRDITGRAAVQEIEL